MPYEIILPKQLFVEGRDDEEFFKALLHKMGLTEDVQVSNYGGANNLLNFLRAVLSTPGPQGLLFQEFISLGITRDAEAGDPADAFRSVCSALNKVGLAVPSRIEELVGSKPKVGVLILPDANTKGMLEDLCLRSIASHPAMRCVEEYFNCLKQQLVSLPGNMPKAQVQAFLASRFEYASNLGVAAQKGYWPWDNPAFEHIKRFLESL